MYVDVSKMTAEELAELAQAVEVEQDKRKAAKPESAYRGWSVTARTHAPCPKCGRDDAVLATKTLYGTAELARGGEPIGTAAYCKCRTWYDAGTGEYCSPQNTY
jgi:hypothetical protein